MNKNKGTKPLGSHNLPVMPTVAVNTRKAVSKRSARAPQDGDDQSMTLFSGDGIDQAKPEVIDLTVTPVKNGDARPPSSMPTPPSEPSPSDEGKRLSNQSDDSASAISANSVKANVIKPAAVVVSMDDLIVNSSSSVDSPVKLTKNVCTESTMKTPKTTETFPPYKSSKDKCDETIPRNGAKSKSSERVKCVENRINRDGIMKKLKPIKLSIKIDRSDVQSVPNKHTITSNTIKSASSDEGGETSSKTKHDSESASRAKTKGDIKKQLQQKKCRSKTQASDERTDSDNADGDDSTENDAADSSDDDIAKQTLAKRMALLKVS